MVIKINNNKKNEKEKFLSKFIPDVLENGDLFFLFSQGEPLVCESEEQDRNRFITDLEVHLGEYSFLKEEVLRILTSLNFLGEFPKTVMLQFLRQEICPGLIRRGKTRRDIINIRNKLFNILKLHEYFVSVFPPHMAVRKLFTINHGFKKFL